MATRPLPTSPAKRHARGLLDWIVVIGIALLVAFLVRTFVLAHFVVDGHSMDTTLHDGDRVFVNKLSYRLHDPNRGDVVVLHEITGAAERDLIKRVIALEGETIEMRNCEVRIDGDVLEEPYLDPPRSVTPGNCGGDIGPTRRPRGPRVRDGRQPGRLAGLPRHRTDRRGRHRRPRVRRVLADEPLALALGAIRPAAVRAAGRGPHHRIWNRPVVGPPPHLWAFPPQAARHRGSLVTHSPT